MKHYHLIDVNEHGIATYAVTNDYKCPHAPQGTPPRLHWSRKGRKRKLFRGHRP